MEKPIFCYMCEEPQPVNATRFVVNDDNDKSVCSMCLIDHLEMEALDDDAKVESISYGWGQPEGL